MSKDTFKPFTSIFTLVIFRIILLIILVILLYNSIWLPAIVVLFLLIITESACWWSKLGLKRLEIKRELSPQRLFPGEKATLRININNRKFLPVIIQYEQKLPEGLGSHPGKTLVLKSRSSQTQTIEISGLKRGYYLIPQLEIISKDGLGLFYSQLNVGGSEELFVYPKIVPLERLDLKSADFIGERVDPRPILPDPLRVEGLREYTPDMPARLIHWKASIQKDQLLAKILEPTAEFKILVAVEINEYFTQGDEDGFEKTLSTAASLAVWAEEQRIPFGLMLNASQKGLEGVPSVPVNQGQGQTILALEKLARVEFNPLGDLQELFYKERKSITWGTTLIIISKSKSISAPPGVRQVVYLSD